MPNIAKIVQRIYKMDKPKFKDLQKEWESIESTPSIETPISEDTITSCISVSGVDTSNYKFLYNIDLNNLIPDFEKFKAKLNASEIYEVISHAIEPYLLYKYEIEVESYEWKYI